MKVRIAVVGAVAALLVVPVFTPTASATGQDWVCGGGDSYGPGARETCTAGASSSISLSSSLDSSPQHFLACTGVPYSCTAVSTAYYLEPAAPGHYHATVVFGDFHAAASADVPYAGPYSYVLLGFEGCAASPTPDSVDLIFGSRCGTLVVHSENPAGIGRQSAPTTLDADEYVVERDLTVDSMQTGVPIVVTSATYPGGSYPMNGLPVGRASSSLSARIVSITLTPI